MKRFRKIDTVVVVVAGAVPPPRHRSAGCILLASNCFQCHGTNGKGPGLTTSMANCRRDYRKPKRVSVWQRRQRTHDQTSLGYTDAQMVAWTSGF